MNKIFNRICALLLTLVVAATFMPFISQEAYAGGGTDINGVIAGLDGKCAVMETTLSVSMTALDDKYGDYSVEYNKGNVGAYWVVCDDKSFSNPKEYKATFSSGKTTFKVPANLVGKYIYFLTNSASDSKYNNNTDPHLIVGAYIDCSLDSKTGKLTVSGKTTDKFVGLYYADKYIKALNGTTFNTVIDTKENVEEYGVGYHSLYAKCSNGNYVYASKAPPTNIYEKPSIKKNSDYFSTGYNYICFRPFFTVPKDVHTGDYIFGKIYIQLYDTKTKKWGDVYGPFDSYEIAKTQYFKGNPKKGGTKIQPNRKYKVRAFYAKTTKYGTQSYPFIGPYSNTVTVKTGKGTKPAVKSITVKAVSTKKVKLIQHAHWDVSGKWIPYKESYTWTTKYKVTVKLKKKPGTTGIMIGSKKIKGNKTKYTATFEDPGKLKGKKIKVAVCTYNDSATGAYGKLYTKKVKMK